MYNKQLILDTLYMIEESLNLVIKRTSHISSVDDFLLTDGGMVLLDSVCMKLIAIGESIKNIDKISEKQLLSQYPSIPWKDVMGLRDIIVHHYFDIDTDQIFKTLQEDIRPLNEVIKQIINDLSNP